MKKIFLVPTCLALLSLAACEISNSADPNGKRDERKPTPAYSESLLSGKIFGQDWKAQVAVLRPSISDKTKLSLDVYATAPTSPCQVAYTSAPYASVFIPADYQVKEYDFDMKTGSLLVFSALTSISKNLPADSAKLKITALNANGFSGYLYANGVEEDGTVSEINGRLQVIDCRKQVAFSVWDDLAGWYHLVEFDGKVVVPLTTTAEFENKTFYNRNTGKYVRSFIIPLVFDVGTNSSASYSVGPMEGLGKTIYDEFNGTKTLTYSFSGPINFEGSDIMLSLDMTVVKTTSNVKVQYTFEVPGQINKTSHSFTLRK